MPDPRFPVPRSASLAGSTAIEVGETLCWPSVASTIATPIPIGVNPPDHRGPRFPPVGDEALAYRRHRDDQVPVRFALRTIGASPRAGDRPEHLIPGGRESGLKQSLPMVRCSTISSSRRPGRRSTCSMRHRQGQLRAWRSGRMSRPSPHAIWAGEAGCKVCSVTKRRDAADRRCEQE